MRNDHNSPAASLRPATPCPDTEELASYVDRVLTDSQQAVVESHLSECEDCREILADAAAFITAENAAGPRAAPAPARSRTVQMGRKTIAGLALAAGVVFAVWVGTNYPERRPFSDHFPEFEALRAAVENEPVRPLSGRLSGIDQHAPALGRLRGQSSGTEDRLSPDTRIAAANVERVASERGERGDPALGVALLIGGETDRAIEVLQRACNNNAQASSCWNDLAVAHLVRAEASNRQDDYTRALEASDRANTLNPRMSEALFNRALALEGLSRTQEAIGAWTHVEENEPGSPWAAEAQTHRRNLSSR